MSPTVTVQIMAGGQSRRMGRDKAEVPLGGTTLLDRALSLWTGWGEVLQVSVGETPRLLPPGVPSVRDNYPLRGPMGGLEAGLALCRTDYLLLTAVDSPFLTPAHARVLLDGAEGADACVFSLNGKMQPLFGLYSPRCLPAVRALLEEGEGKMGLLLRRVETRCLPTEDRAAFRNLNTPEELAEAQREWDNSGIFST